MFTEEDKALIKELDLETVSEAYQAQQLKHFYETLHVKISMALEDTLTDEQLAEFEKINQRGDDKALAAWFKKAVPYYEQIVTDQTIALKHDIKQTADRLKAVINDGAE
jgi:hypothetical protein